ncbi:MAG: hypothetical protein XD40_0823 [Archaeoglobus fulgidus]|uniref:Uncharacterized protein n=1 Tax=Archaeoglobus fulgidus TaxID=2234 RepID=A0A101E1E0_ARCFL|nr:hypothetical protein [Archaeoglobus fulgidus]KUJ94002.1 MAG: hypothetical protein XD40_0823 [Archaeoglobus fulgidus]KUK07032.1 MAG: hypothetical protein XD48_0744 [Archaeoglobus fulgidus]
MIEIPATRITELPGCFRLDLTCPVCGKPGILFLSKKVKPRDDIKKNLRVYHERGYCLVPKTNIMAAATNYFYCDSGLDSRCP